MKFAILFFTAIFVAVLPTFLSKPLEDHPADDFGWWDKLKQRARSAFHSWQDSLGRLWDVVLDKTDSMRNWTMDTYRKFKLKIDEWLNAHKDVPDEKKEEIEEFILKFMPTEGPYPSHEVEDEMIPSVEPEFSTHPFYENKEENIV